MTRGLHCVAVNRPWRLHWQLDGTRFAGLLPDVAALSMHGLDMTPRIERLRRTPATGPSAAAVQEPPSRTVGIGPGRPTHTLGLNASTNMLTQVMILLLGAMLFGYTCSRAYLLSFTHDESVTYVVHVQSSLDDILHFRVGIAPSNNHLLNTLLVKLSASLFGQSELALRAPNLLAHLMYLSFSYLLVDRFSSSLIKLSGFILLNANPFLLEHFSLARGYGLALAFMLGSLYFALRCFDAEELKPTDLFLPPLFAAYAVMASLTFIHFYVALAGVLAVLTLWRLVRAMVRAKQGLSLKKLGIIALYRNLPLLISTLMWAVVMVPGILRLGQANDIHSPGGGGDFPGQQPNFWNVTITSLLQLSLYGRSYLAEWMPIVAAAVAVVVLVNCALLVAHLLRYRIGGSTLPLSILPIAGLMASTTIGEHYLFDVGFLNARMTILFVPVLGLLALNCLYAVSSIGGPARPFGVGLAALVGILCLVHAVNSLDFTSTQEAWVYADTRRMIDDLTWDYESSDQVGRQVSLGTTPWVAPIVTYYRTTRGLAWLMNADLDGDVDYSYYATWEERDLRGRAVATIAEYPSSEHVLAKRTPG